MSTDHRHYGGPVIVAVLVVIFGICIVSKERFEKTEVGMKVLCAWHGAQLPAPKPTSRDQAKHLP